MFVNFLLLISTAFLWGKLTSNWKIDLNKTKIAEELNFWEIGNIFFKLLSVSENPILDDGILSRFLICTILNRKAVIIKPANHNDEGIIFFEKMFGYTVVEDRNIFLVGVPVFVLCTWNLITMKNVINIQKTIYLANWIFLCDS